MNQLTEECTTRVECRQIGFRCQKECMESKFVTGKNDALQSLVTVLHGSGWTMLKYISIQNLK